MKKLLRVLVIAALLVAIAIPCLASGTETTAPHVHDFGEWTVEPSTCIAEGKMTRVCKADGCNLPDNTETKTIAKKDHTWGDPEVGTPATCTKAGAMIHKCKTEKETTRRRQNFYQESGHHSYGCAQIRQEASGAGSEVRR